MSINTQINATIHPKHTHQRNAEEHARIAARFQPSARDLFPHLRERLLASRPVTGERVIRLEPTGRNKMRAVSEPVFGAPTFRNRIAQNGAWA